MSRCRLVYVPWIETGKHVKNNACAVEIKIKWIKRKQMTHENTYRDDIPRTLLNKDLLIFVPGPGLQLLFVFIMNSAKNVIKIFTIRYIFLQNISKFQEKSFINKYLITNYWFWTQCVWPGPGPCMVTTFISNRYEYDELTQFSPRFNFYSPLSRIKTPTYPCIIYFIFD